VMWKVHRSTKSLAKTMETNGLVIQEIEWGGMHLGIEKYNERIDLAPLLKGLPDDSCQSPHWGYMVKGSMWVIYKEDEEVIKAGDAYYLPPGHIAIVEANSEMVEFSPKDAYQKTHEAVERNFATMQKRK
jgi:hypothetical protein